MPSRTPNDIKPSEITSESAYLNRRRFIQAGIAAGSLAATGLLYRTFSPAASTQVATPEIGDVKPSASPASELTKNTYEEITNYNNFYEFSTSKSAVAAKAQSLVTRPWTVQVGGLVQKPKTFDIDDLLKFEQHARTGQRRGLRP